MKKVAVIVQSKDSDEALRGLRSLGMIHIEHQTAPKGEAIAALHEKISLVDKVLTILSVDSARAGKGRGEAADLTVAKHIVDTKARFDQLEEYSGNIRKKINELEEWGDFDPKAIERLAQQNIYARLYQIPLKGIKTLPESVIVKVISKKRGIANCVVVSREKTEIAAKEFALPKTGLAEMQRRLDEDLEVLAELREELKRQVRHYGAFMRMKRTFEHELELSSALAGMGRSGEIAYLVGYCPHDGAARVIHTAKANRWGILVSEPSEGDAVPTLIRNPRWVSIIEPVFRLMEIVPGYRELDISPIFLLFLSLFFGMIIGDAGYGALYIGLTAFAHKRLGKRLKDTRIFFLLYLFSASAVMWGILTGTVFGQEWYLKSGMRPLLPILNNTRFLQALCFFIGAFHLTLGQAWQAIRKLPSLAALADTGWVLVLWAAFFMARTLILSYPLPAAVKWLVVAGVLFVIFFSNPQRNVLKAALSGLGALALSLMNNFTDVVSYIRLFAVGLAGVAISDTVNELAASLGSGSPASRIGILFIGHTINIALGPIAVMVHGLRLNVLEFSSHAGLGWSGTAYRPLSE